MNVCVHEQFYWGDFVSFYDRFTFLCNQKGVKPSRAAEECGINRSNVTMWKNNGSTPRGDALNKIAEYFGVSTDILLGLRYDIPDDENPYELELREVFDSLDLDSQIQAVNAVKEIGNKKMPAHKKDERDGSEILFALSRGGEQEITDEMFDEVKKFAAYIAQREKDKK